MQSRYYNPEIGRFINADSVIPDVGTNILSNNMFAYCINNPVNMTDSTGNWPEWVENAAKVFAGVAIVITTVMVITGTGGTAAALLLGAACGGATGGYFNEKAGGSFTSGYIGGAVSGTIQGFAGNAFGPVGVALGGSAGSGIGTLIAESIDNHFAPPEQKKQTSQILADSGKSAAVALATSSLTGYVSGATDLAVSTQAYGLMPTITKTFGEMIKSFFGAIDDAMTYIVLME